MKGIILHGGHGTRLRPLTHTGPKQLLPIGNKPMSEYCVEALRESGITEIAFVVGGIGSNKVKDYYKNGEKFNVNFSYIEQDSPKGIAHAINLCKDFIGNEKFVVFLGDNLINMSIKNFVINFENSSSDAELLLCDVDNPEQFGIAYLDGDRISKMVEKPKNPTSSLAITGIYFLTPKIFEKIKKLKPSWRNELEIVDALQMILDDGDQISYNMITDFWKDTGTPHDIIHANQIVLEKMTPKVSGTIGSTVEIDGNFSLGQNSIVENDCKIVGPVIIGNDCIIEKNSVIGPNVSIGNNSKISNCHIENSIVMEYCQLDTNITITDSILANNSQISSSNTVSTKNNFLLGEGTKINL